MKALGAFYSIRVSWVDFGDNLTWYILCPYFACDRMCRKQFALLCLGLRLEYTSWFPKQITMQATQMIRRPEAMNETVSKFPQ